MSTDAAHHVAEDYLRAIATGDERAASDLLYRSPLEDHALMQTASPEQRATVVGVTWQDRADRLGQGFAQSSQFWSRVNLMESAVRVVTPGQVAEVYFLIKHPDLLELEWRCLVLRSETDGWRVDQEQRTTSDQLIAYLPACPSLFGPGWEPTYRKRFGHEVQIRTPSELIEPQRVFLKQHPEVAAFREYSHLSEATQAALLSHDSVVEVSLLLEFDIETRLQQIRDFGHVLCTFAELGAPAIYLPAANAMLESQDALRLLSAPAAAPDELGAFWVAFHEDSGLAYSRGMGQFRMPEIEVPSEGDDSAFDRCVNMATYSLQTMKRLKPGDTIAMGDEQLLVRHGRRGPSDVETYGLHGSVVVAPTR
jgi:hypothetical protein